MPFRQADDFFTLEVIFMELVNKLRANIKRWRVLPLTMTVRVNPIKMVSLLTLLLYLLVATSHTESLHKSTRVGGLGLLLPETLLLGSQFRSLCLLEVHRPIQ